jgi:hypothetical protein
MLNLGPSNPIGLATMPEGRAMGKHKKHKGENLNGLFAYTDESGNTGQNLFDEAQPYFWTGTLITNADVDITGQAAHKKWISRLGVPELHGNELGIARIKHRSRTEEFSGSPCFPFRVYTN